MAKVSGDKRGAGSITKVQKRQGYGEWSVHSDLTCHGKHRCAVRCHVLNSHWTCSLGRRDLISGGPTLFPSGSMGGTENRSHWAFSRVHSSNLQPSSCCQSSLPESGTRASSPSHASDTVGPFGIPSKLRSHWG